jgi:hypothetical protein
MMKVNRVNHRFVVNIKAVDVVELISILICFKKSKKEIHAKTEGNPAFEEEKIIIYGDSKHNRGLATVPIETDSKITTTKKYEKGNIWKKIKNYLLGLKMKLLSLKMNKII